MTGPTAQQIAEAVRDAMWRDDRASKALGMQVLAIGPGTATMSMTVREDMLNGHDICHGGLIATLADSTFAFACNAYNEVTVPRASTSTSSLPPGSATC
jgi:acyl-CoA thioesterase